MKKQLLAATISMVITSAASANSWLPGHDHTQCDGVVHSPLSDVLFAEQAKQVALNKQNAAAFSQVRSNDSSGGAIFGSGVNVTNVVVVMNKSWLDKFSEQYTKDGNGKYFESGAQLAVERIQKQFDKLNEVFEFQKVNTRLVPAYFAVVDNVTAVDGKDLADAVACVFSSDEILDFYNLTANCIANGFDRVKDIARGKVDLLYYVREQKYEDIEYVVGGAPYRVTDTAGGHGIHRFGFSVYDTYMREAKYFELLKQSGLIPVNEAEEGMRQVRYGYTLNGVFVHEVGHAFGTMHEVSDNEPITTEANRAYACGPTLFSYPSRNEEFRNKKATIDWSSVGSWEDPNHYFFSDPEISVSGDPCGVFGAANNISYVRDNAATISFASTKVAPSASVSFVINELVLNRSEEKGQVVLRRTGDLSAPSHVNLLAQDDTAWELRDFKFGLKEVAFAAGESEKTIEFDILPRSERHPDTRFDIIVRQAIGASFTDTPVSVTIASDNKALNGEVGFERSTLSTFEGDILELVFKRTNGTDGEASFTVTAESGTAVEGVDFKPVSATVTIKDGQNTGTAMLETIKRDTAQGARSLKLKISQLNGAALGQAEATVTIADVTDVVFAQTQINATEGNTATVEIRRSNDLTQAVSVNVSSVNGTATAGVDYQAVNQTVNFAANQTTATVVVSLINREGTQGTRSFQLNLSSSTAGVSIGSASSATINISDVAVVPPTTPSQPDSGKSGGSTGVFFIFSLLGVVLSRWLRS